MRSFAGQVEDRLQNAYKAGNYTKKLGFKGMDTKSMNDDDDAMSTRSAPGTMSTFEKLLHKDNKKLNRMQEQARNYLEKEGGFTGEISKMSSASRLSSASLPDLTGKGRIGGAQPLIPAIGAAGSAARQKTGGPGSV